MPVDFAPLIFGVSFLAIAIITIAGFRHRIIRTIGCIIFLLLFCWYVDLYHLTEIRFSHRAQNQDPEAMYRLGSSLMHYHRGCEYNPIRGRELLTKAAEKGQLEAQLVLASYYLTAVEMPQDTNAAFMWYAAAANQGNPDAKEMVQRLKSEPFDVNQPTGKISEIAFKWIDK